MNLFSRLRRSNEIHSQGNKKNNNKPIPIGNTQKLFDNIGGFEDIKSLFEMAIKAERPVHLLLCGPPASAKSLFMRMQLEVILQNLEYLIIYLNIPRYFIIDELEKMNKKDQTSLLNLMESGILSELKHNQQRTTQLKNMGICFM